MSGENLINIATDHSSSVDSKEFRDIYRKFTKDDVLMVIDVVNSKFYKKKNNDGLIYLI